jgi:hypothetical protein
MIKHFFFTMLNFTLQSTKDNKNNTKKMMKLTQTSSVSDSLKGRKNPRSYYCLAISGYLSVGDIVYMAPSSTINEDDWISIHSKMLTQFWSNKTFGQVTNLYNKNTEDADEEDVLLDINLYLKQEALSSSLRRFSSRVPEQCMPIQTDLDIEGWRMDDIIGTVMVVHADNRSRRAYWISIF